MKRIGQFFTRRKDRKGTGASNGSSGEKRGSMKESMDYLFLEEDKEIQEILKEGEQIIFSDYIEKFNRKNKKQKRSILITNHHVYNLNGITLKRKIEIQKIKKIITSRFSGEFILNIPDEYDYRYISTEESQKQVIIEILCSISSGLQILYADQAELAEVVTTRKEKEQQQQLSSNLYGLTSTIAQASTNQYQISLNNTLNSSPEITSQNTVQRHSILNNLFSLSLFSHSNHNAPIQENDQTKEDIQSNKERRLKKVPSFERGIQMNFNDFELLDYLGFNDAWRYFRVRECGNDSKKVYQMRVINTSTHLKQEVQQEEQISTCKQFVQEQIQLMKELDSSYFSQQYYYIKQGNYFAVLQEELDTSKYIDLAQLIDEQSFLSENVAKVIAAQIAHSLHILHSKKIVYNQVNPKDIKIDLAGNTILTRFEFSKFFFTPLTVSPTSSMTSLSPKNSSTKLNTLTFSSSVFNTDDSPKKYQSTQKDLNINGSKDYTSPELIRGSQNSYNSDWWSFGILLYEMLLGFTPFFDQNSSKMEQKILNQKDIDFPKMANISISAKNLIMKCLDKNPKNRIKGADILNHEFFSGVKWGEIKERVPQFEVSQLFNLEKQYSEENSTSDIFKVVQQNQQIDETMTSISDKNCSKLQEDQEKENEDQEETIILSEVSKPKGQNENLYCSNFNFITNNRNTFQLMNQA